ncbi:hypothetical protein BHE74_00052725 [Ensete ventricosum]|nr:hypothetical protein GW17_00035626 [Ensete ventricosum]RWW41772.1 hypothetical protein BHE74_00052725 [Ensete ventricosum]RZS21159.1 hypothetical protein BHM03_00053758 [Ensete ventricosum]
MALTPLAPSTPPLPPLRSWRLPLPTATTPTTNIAAPTGSTHCELTTSGCPLRAGRWRSLVVGALQSAAVAGVALQVVVPASDYCPYERPATGRYPCGRQLLGREENRRRWLKLQPINHDGCSRVYHKQLAATTCSRGRIKRPRHAIVVVRKRRLRASLPQVAGDSCMLHHHVQQRSHNRQPRPLAIDAYRTCSQAIATR